MDHDRQLVRYVGVVGKEFRVRDVHGSGDVPGFVLVRVANIGQRGCALVEKA